MDPGPAGGDRRCPDCGALASLDAEWCGQCLRPLKEPEPDPEPESEPRQEPVGVATAVGDRPSTAPATDQRPAPAWPCPTCGASNPIELDACTVCGTTFAALMRRDEAPPSVEPSEAMRASLLFPGLGHKRVGRGLDGLARGALFAILATMAIVVLASGLESAIATVVLAIFVFGALAVYAGSTWEAHHLASGGRPLISSKALLWVSVGVVLGSVVLLAIAAVSAAR